MKKRNTLLMAGILVLTGIGLSLSAGKTSDAKVSLTLKKGVLTVSGKGAMKDKQILTRKKQKKVKKIIIKKGVTSLPDYSFSQCNNTTKLTIANTVKKIGVYSFVGMKLKTLTIPKSVKRIGWGILNGCQITTLKMPGSFISVGPKEDGGYDHINIGKKRDRVKTVKFTTALTAETVCRVNADNLIPMKTDPLFTQIDGVLYSKDKTILRAVPSLRSELTVADGCKTVDIGAFLYGTCDYEGDFYSSATLLTKVTFPSSVTKVCSANGSLFPYDSEVDDLMIADSVRTVVLNTKDIDESSIRILWQVFAIARTTLGEELTRLGLVINTDGMLSFDHKSIFGYIGAKKDVTIPDGIELIEDRVFEGKDLTGITLPASIRTIGDYAFHINNLTHVSFPEGLVKIGTAAFMSNQLSELSFPSTLKSLGSSAFSYNPLVTLTLPLSVTEYDTSWWGPFRSCEKLKEVTVPEGMTCLPDSIFMECTALEKVNIPSTLKVIGDSTFRGCRSLDINKVLTGSSITEIGAYAFENIVWDNLTIPASVQKIGAHAFEIWGNNGQPDMSTERTVTILNPDIELADVAFTPRRLTYIYPEGAFEKVKTGLFYGKTIELDRKNHTFQCRLRYQHIAGAEGYEVKVFADQACTREIGSYDAAAEKWYVDTDKMPFNNATDRLGARIRAYKTVNGVRVYSQWGDLYED